jgi:hypothetical protein
MAANDPKRTSAAWRFHTLEYPLRGAELIRYDAASWTWDACMRRRSSMQTRDSFVINRDRFDNGRFRPCGLEPSCIRSQSLVVSFFLLLEY